MPSLTLASPDMILPFDGSERESQTPSPPSQLVYLSHLNAPYNSANLNASTAGRTKKNYSRHNWTYDEMAASRRLSDIGEELSPARSDRFDDGALPPEVQQQQQQQSLPPTPVSPLGSKNPPRLKQLAEAERQYLNSLRRRGSSGSTASARSVRSPREAHSTQNVPEVSPNPSAEETGISKGTVAQGPNGTSLLENDVAAPTAKDKGPGEDLSSMILSSEAERILENAKKRLTLMEGNLNRARSTVRQTPSSSPLGLHPGGLYRSISKADRKSSALRRQSNAPAQDASANRHSRVQSETNFRAESNLASGTSAPSRSISAMGSSSPANFNDDRSFPYAPTRSYLTHRASISSIRPPHLISTQSPSPKISPSPAPMESPVLPSPTIYEEAPSASPPKGLGITTQGGESPSSGGSFSPVQSSNGFPSRSQSQMQVRDLQYQMKGLHIKISSLKVRNQEDNLRRRSLQSLRTPSPLTAADPFLQNALEARDGRSSQGSNPRREGSSENVAAIQTRASREEISKDRNRAHPSEHKINGTTEPSPALSQNTSGSWRNHHEQYYQNGRHSSAETMYEDAEEGDYFDDGEIDREALNEILREPLDPDLDTPHEEREDAFDYEHFILHSALGNFSQPLRRESLSSHGSVETTRPAQSVRHARNDSSLSVSTVATFATATEGVYPEDENDLLYWDRKFNQELRQRHHAPPSNGNSRSAAPHTTQENTHSHRSQTPQASARHVESKDRSPTTGPSTPTALVSSLVTTMRAASSPHTTSSPSGSVGNPKDDTEILERVFASLGKVCTDLQAITDSADPDLKAARVLRRRLDAARRVLDGELDA
ncbi:hypothetical protein N7539_004172 [Penicillium diatomitis]|uniref:Uncharacterized protein n=1 Tax=Penicillium diatomitis TaxID=2819901 RepID=A0A9X0BYK0_9EURO|nr:uncharacterized protein N7539_004172 [Penicillium diatomitis]KAJ5489282.1 hypothetical protein N7539_004172 [Penicillium diatomitis]